MKYDVLIERKALKFIKAQPKDQQKRIFSAISRLPDAGDIRPLKGYPGVWRLRVGGYRILYSVDRGRLVVTVVDAGNRGEIYNAYTNLK